jgi:predicted enzyme related to lactoylglutathione lyase
MTEWFYGISGADRFSTSISLFHVDGAPPLRPAGESMESTAVSFNLTGLDVNAICARIAQYGGRVVSAPVKQQPDGPFPHDMALVADPDGNIIELTHFY